MSTQTDDCRSVAEAYRARARRLAERVKAEAKGDPALQKRLRRIERQLRELDVTDELGLTPFEVFVMSAVVAYETGQRLHGLCEARRDGPCPDDPIARAAWELGQVAKMRPALCRMFDEFGDLLRDELALVAPDADPFETFGEENAAAYLEMLLGLDESSPPASLHQGAAALLARWRLLRGQLLSDPQEARGLRRIVPSDRSDAASERPETAHSIDFCSVRWYGQEYTFTPSQAAVVKLLWDARENGTPTMREQTLLADIESDCERLRDLFRNHPALGGLIVSGERRGTWRLAD